MLCPIPNARGTLRPEGRGSCGVLILGEAMGDQEADDGLPFRPTAPAGSVLERAIRRIGCTRDMFALWNVLPVQPPKNFINPAWEAAAIEWGREFIEEQIDRFHPRCILTLGNTATRAMTGLSGDKLGVTHLSGYVLPGLKPTYPPIVPCFHPSYMRRGAMGLFGVLMRTLKLAMAVAKGERSLVLPPYDSPPAGYVLSPNEHEADDFALYCEEALDPKTYLAYDIETMYSNSEEDAEERPDDIRSVQFSYGYGTGVYMPWRQPYIEIAKRVLATPLPKLNWNGWRFDDPLLRSNGCRIEGTILDLMWAWHHSQPDLPRGLQFAAAMQGPNIFNPTHVWPWAWKHLDRQSPRFYGIVDVDVLQWMVSYV